MADERDAEIREALEGALRSLGFRPLREMRHAEGSEAGQGKPAHIEAGAGIARPHDQREGEGLPHPSPEVAAAGEAVSRNAGMGPRMIDNYVPDEGPVALKAMGFGKRMLDDAPETVVPNHAQNAPAPHHDLMGPAGPLDHAPAPVGPQASTQDVGGAIPAPAADPLARGYSAEEVKQLATEAPGRLVELFEAELGRPDGPRKSVLRTLLRVEGSQPAPNPTVVAALTRVLGDLG